MSIRRVIISGLIVLASWHGLAAGAIMAKALLAQYLLQDAWDAAQAGEANPKPWRWADMWPVARLRFESRGQDLIVLSDATGRSLAFGPGLSGDVQPGEPGHSVVAGHRDTHFSFLEEVRPGDRFSVELADGVRRAFRVIDVAIVDSGTTRINTAMENRILSLVTCYPFASVEPGGPLRYVVISQPDVEPEMRDALSGFDLLDLTGGTGILHARATRSGPTPAI